jgi:hypothetical protein
VSKKHGAKRKHRKKARRTVLCTSCGQTAAKPWGPLAALAAALNACEDAGIKVVLTGWQTVVTKKGYVVRLRDRKWAARDADYLPFDVAIPDDTMTPDGFED